MQLHNGPLTVREHDELRSLVGKRHDYEITPLHSQISAIMGRPEKIFRFKPDRQGAYTGATDDQLCTEREMQLGVRFEKFMDYWEDAIKTGKPQPKFSCVYFISGGGLTKIGYTSDLPSRLSHYKMHSPVELHLMRVLVCFEGDDRAAKRAEKIMHREYAGKRKHGEWFDMDNSDYLRLDQACAEWLISCKKSLS